MRKFCKKVLEFLLSEYEDSYKFEINYKISMSSICEAVELIVEASPNYKIIIGNDSMYYLFGWYLNGEFIKERNQYRWQKELVDMIEGS